LVYVNFDDLVLAPDSTLVHGHKFKLYTSAKRLNAYVPIFFSERVINCWNSVSHTVDFSSFSKFKHTVKRVDFTDFLRYYCALFINLSFV